MAESSKKSDTAETNTISDGLISLLSIPTMLVMCGIVALIIGGAFNVFTNNERPFPS